MKRNHINMKVLIMKLLLHVKSNALSYSYILNLKTY